MGKSKIRAGTVVYIIIYFTLSFALIGAICYGLWHLWQFLEAYEKSQPDIPVKQVIQQLHKDSTIYFDKFQFTPNEFEEKSFALGYFKDLFKGRITYSRNGKLSSEEKTVYTLKSENKNIANVTVTPTGKDLGYDLKEYEAVNIEFGSVETDSFTVSAPCYAKVYCNGKLLSENYISQTGEKYEGEEHFYNMSDPFYYDVTYTIDGFIKEPEFTAEDMDNNPLELKDGKFSHKSKKDENAENTALEFSKSYCEFIERDANVYKPLGYLAPNVPLDNDLRRFDNIYGHVHWGYDFINADISDAFFFSNNAVLVEVKFDHVLYNVAAEISPDREYHLNIDYSVYLVNIDGEWKVTELVVN